MYWLFSYFILFRRGWKISTYKRISEVKRCLISSNAYAKYMNQRIFMSLQNIKRRKFTDNQFIWQYCFKSYCKEGKEGRAILKKWIKIFWGKQNQFRIKRKLSSKQTNSENIYKIFELGVNANGLWRWLLYSVDYYLLSLDQVIIFR